MAEIVDFDHLSLSCCKPNREGNIVEFNGKTDCKGGLSVVMASSSGHVVLDEEAETELRNFLTRRQSRAIRLARKARASSIALALARTTISTNCCECKGAEHDCTKCGGSGCSCFT